jgi:ATP-dependent Clp protease ATP-binding subunit ClpC
MPKINVYLSDELADAVKQANLPVSAICQRALEHAVRRVTALHETVQGAGEAGLDDPTGKFGRFTGRARAVVSMAVDDARADRRPVTSADLLAALLDEGGNLGLRVLRALEVEPQELSAALAGRHPAGAAAEDAEAVEFAADTREALRLAVNESSGFGHNYIGCEHLLLGLVAEPDGPAGQLLRAAGVELRLARRAVSAALAGYAAHAESPRHVAAAGGDMVAALTEAVRAQLAPVVARLDRLEGRLDG